MMVVVAVAVVMVVGVHCALVAASNPELTPCIHGQFFLYT